VSKRKVPEPWATAMIEVGAVFRGRPSWREVARRTGIDAGTIIKIVDGTTVNPKAPSIAKLASALQRSPEEISAWIGQNRVVRGPWEPPAESSRMDERMRAAFAELIKATVAAPQTGTGMSDVSTADMEWIVKELRSSSMQGGADPTAVVVTLPSEFSRPIFVVISHIRADGVSASVRVESLADFFAAHRQ
jgi:transcriptional regulator with XRE-family HTH domain